MNFKKDALPHVLAIAFILVLYSIFFSPVYSGKQLVQGDIINSRGAVQAINEHYIKHGERTLWTNSLFGGMPTYMVSTIYYGQIIHNGFQEIISILPHPINTFCLGAIAFYILLLSMGTSIPIAILGAIGFSFTSYELVTIEAGHNSKVYTTFMLPFLLSGVLLVFQKKYIKGLVICALSSSLLITGNHYQIIYYFVFGLVAIGVYYVIIDLKNNNINELIKKIGVLVIAALIGIGSNAGKLLCDFDYIPNSTRGKKELVDNKAAGSKADAAMGYDYAFAWSQGKLETATLLIPFYYGGSSVQKLDKKSNVYKAVKENTRDNAQAKSISQSAPLYWGQQPGTSGPIYFGAVFCFLFVLALFSWKNNLKYVMIGVVLFLTMIAWGGNFKILNYFLFDYFPGMNKFRAVAMALSVAQLFFMIIAAMGVHQFVESTSDDKQKILFKSAGITLGITALLIMIGLSQSFSGPIDAKLSQWPVWLKEALFEDRKALLISDGLRSMVMIAIGATILYLLHVKKLTYQIGMGALILISLSDLWVVNKRYVYEDKFKKKVYETSFKATPASEFILQDKDYNRVFNVSSNTFNENITSYYHNSVGGYRPAKMQRYQDLAENRLYQEKQILTNALKQTQNETAFNKQLFPNMNTLNMLNTKYIIYNPNAKPLINQSALGNAWFVKDVAEVNTANEEMDYIKVKEWNPSQSAVINKEQYSVSQKAFAGTGEIKLTNYKADEMTYEVTASDKSFIVFSDIFYPNGWNVTIDDQDAEFVRTNYVLRGLEVPKGKHTIKCEFKPSVYTTGNSISMVSSIGLLLLIGFGIFKSFKGTAEPEDLDEE